MKRLQIMIDEDLDAELGRLAAAQRTSKAALIRALVRAQLAPPGPLADDPVRRMAGTDSFEPAPIDDVVYG
jgi:hypothetical protein